MRAKYLRSCVPLVPIFRLTVNFNTVKIYMRIFVPIFMGFYFEIFVFCVCVCVTLADTALEGNNHIQYLHLWMRKDMRMCVSLNHRKEKTKTNENKQDKVLVARAQSFIGVNCMPQIAAAVAYLNINSIRMCNDKAENQNWIGKVNKRPERQRK